MATLDCPRLYPLKVLSRKWSYVVLRALRQRGSLSFARLSDELHYATNHTLAAELRYLVTEELIHKTSDSIYNLTPAGASLVDAVESLHRWSVEHKKLRVCPASMSCSKCSRYPELIQLR